MGVHQLWFADGKYIHFSGGAADFEPTHPADSAVLPLDRHFRPGKAGRGGPMVGARNARGRRRPAAESTSHLRHRHPGAQHECLSGATGPGLSRLYRRRNLHTRHFRHGGPDTGRPLESAPAAERVQPYRPAAVRPRPADRQRRMHPGRRPGLAQAHLGAGCAGRDQSRFDLDPAVAPGRGIRPARRALRVAQYPREPAGLVLPPTR